jgi:hypothetical protein
LASFRKLKNRPCGDSFFSRTPTPPLASLSRKTIPACSRADWIRIRIEKHRGRLFGLVWPLTIAQSHTRTAAVLVDEPEPNWVRFVDRRLEAGPPKRDAPTLAFLVAGALAAALQDLNRVGFAMSAARPVCSQLLP